MTKDRTRHLSAILLPAAVFVMLSMATPTYADGGDATQIHACVLRLFGLTRIVEPNEACRPGEAPVHWAITGPAGPAGPAGASGSAAIKVVDANGTQVGDVIGVEFGTPVVILDVAGRLVAVTVRPQVFSGTDTQVYFLEPDCAGTPHVLDLGRALFPVVSTPDDGLSLYLANAEAPVVRTHPSRLQTPGVCVALSAGLQVRPSIPATLMTLPFAAPFHVE